MATKKESIETVKFSKESLLSAIVFVERKDALGACIMDGEMLTIEEAQTRLDEFMKRKVD